MSVVGPGRPATCSAEHGRPGTGREHGARPPWGSWRLSSAVTVTAGRTHSHRGPGAVRATGFVVSRQGRAARSLGGGEGSEDGGSSRGAAQGPAGWREVGGLRPLPLLPSPVPGQGLSLNRVARGQDASLWGPRSGKPHPRSLLRRNGPRWGAPGSTSCLRFLPPAGTRRSGPSACLCSGPLTPSSSGLHGSTPHACAAGTLQPGPRTRPGLLHCTAWALRGRPGTAPGLQGGPDRIAASPCWALGHPGGPGSRNCALSPPSGVPVDPAHGCLGLASTERSKGAGSQRQDVRSQGWGRLPGDTSGDVASVSPSGKRGAAL